MAAVTDKDRKRRHAHVLIWIGRGMVGVAVVGMALLSLRYLLYGQPQIALLVYGCGSVVLVVGYSLTLLGWRLRKKAEWGDDAEV